MCGSVPNGSASQIRVSDSRVPVASDVWRNRLLITCLRTEWPAVCALPQPEGVTCCRRLMQAMCQGKHISIARPKEAVAKVKLGQYLMLSHMNNVAHCSRETKYGLMK